MSWHTCPVCAPSDNPGHTWDDTREVWVACRECGGSGTLHAEEMRLLALVTERDDLSAFLGERDPALTLAELGFTDLGAEVL